MKLVPGLIGSVVGGLIGAAVWAAIVYFTNYEIGFVAWGIGAVVGFGMAAGSGGQGGPLAGVAAAVVALAAVALGKLAIAVIYTGGVTGPRDFNDREAIASIADRNCYFAESEDGQRLNWPPNMTYDQAEAYEDYPADMIALAEQQWNGCPAPIQQMCRKTPVFAVPEVRTSVFADALMAERGRTDLSLPGGVEVGSRPKHYPADIWADAVKWEASMSIDEQAAFLKPVIDADIEAMRQAFGQLQGTVFTSMFSPWDLLWFGLAAFTAFQIGARQTAASPSPTP